MRCCSQHRQQGIALLMAMLVVALASVTAVSLMHEQSFSVRRTANMQHYNAALLYGVGLEDYARLFLNKDAKNSKTDHLEEDWAIGIPLLTIEGGFLSGQIVDAQSKININNLLSDEASRLQLLRLCENLQVSADFIPALIDWIDNNVEVEIPDGAEDDYYTTLEIPYRAANRMMADVSELRLVKGVDAEIYEKIRPFLTTLPEKTSLNLNTISAEVFDSLGLDKSSQAFIEERELDAFSSIDDFSKRLDIVLDEQQQRGLSVASSYFWANGVVTLNDKSVQLNSLLYRSGQGQTRVLTRSLGNLL